jgi:hypothetical protein
MKKNAPVNSTQAQFARPSRQSGLAAPKPLRRRRVNPMLFGQNAGRPVKVGQSESNRFGWSSCRSKSMQSLKNEQLAK